MPEGSSETLKENSLDMDFRPIEMKKVFAFLEVEYERKFTL